MFGGIPFEHFAGGMPGGKMPGPPTNEDVDTTKLYETLEVSKDADAKEIKKSYRRLSRIHHPDKGGDEHKFKEISAAYEILSDADQRKLYDEYGLNGVEDGAPSAGGEDLFSMFFRGGSHRRANRGPRKGPALNHPLKVSLDDVYNGRTVKLAVRRKVIVGEVKTCNACDGHGIRMEVRQLGPGMIQQMQRQCSECNGQGNKAETKTERQILEVCINRGAREGQRIKFEGMGDEIPGMEAGDINIIIKIKDHSIFKRNGADLLVQKELSLNQALCGFAFNLTHLDGRKISIRSKPGEIIRPESNGVGNQLTPFCKLIQNEGMPSIRNPFIKGNLYILFRVKFPVENSLSSEQIRILKEILPDPDMECEYDAEADDVVEVVEMNAADFKHFGHGGVTGGEENAYNSDGDDAQPVQCQQS
eukprot:458608_1